MIPTKRVILKASGDEIIINASDYDEELHGPLGKRAEKKAAADPAQGKDPQGKGAADAGDDIVGRNAADAKALVEATNDLADLDALEAAEEANEKYDGGRAGVLAAIADRRAELKAAK